MADSHSSRQPVFCCYMYQQGMGTAQHTQYSLGSNNLKENKGEHIRQLLQH